MSIDLLCFGAVCLGRVSDNGGELDMEVASEPVGGLQLI